MTAVATQPARSLVVEVPGLRLVSLTNGNKWAKFASHKARNEQRAALNLHVRARALRCPLPIPLDVTIVRLAPGRFDSDNMVACGKYVRDWLAEWIGVSDSRDDLVRWLYEQERTKVHVYGCRIEVRGRVS